ncbi:hypothetical protein J422_05110 [Methanocaldococcus villosus KIN24-T80]|uniref:Methyltransferase type 11 domain-containing protein n=1 Tax=Methanocaldococcus villosus KIN24-T80 TaxID=1069083 RepID=N6UUH6_9EURY|nr:class I SAM-dependent methyltransferase [Methanocaldococcus villosus]ENN95994.1 hypothetical protein J422_05110 [Methanocaldococcus villosus KIN24-T80]
MDIEEFYDNWNPEEFPDYIKILMEFADRLIKNEIKKLLVEEPKFVLDCGCGFGAFYELTKDHNTLYLDISFYQLKKFKIKEKKICSNMLYLPFKNEVFDLILCINVLEHVNYKRALEEMFRVLKKGGRIIVVVINKNRLINEEIFTEFKIYHQPLSIKDFYNINFYTSVYFLPSFFKILPSRILKVFLKYWIFVDRFLSKLFKDKGLFLIIEMVKK